MTRRRAPRPAVEAIRAARDRAAPKAPLAALQAAWATAVGEAIAAVSQPVSERDGAAVIDCVDAVWTEELNLMQRQLLARLREQMGEGAPSALRFRAKGNAPNPFNA